MIVDGANVVGSRPDGWWRDRAGAAARLHAKLVATDLEAAEIILVLEGQARGGVPVGRVGRVRTVHAIADGDSAMIDLVASRVGPLNDVAVVTADRGLIAGVTHAGGSSLKPSWLLAQVDPEVSP